MAQRRMKFIEIFARPPGRLDPFRSQHFLPWAYMVKTKMLMRNAAVKKQTVKFGRAKIAIGMRSKRPPIQTIERDVGLVSNIVTIKLKGRGHSRNVSNHDSEPNTSRQHGRRPHARLKTVNNHRPRR